MRDIDDDFSDGCSTVACGLCTAFVVIVCGFAVYGAGHLMGFW
jgi:hypothetical protein